MKTTIAAIFFASASAAQAGQVMDDSIARSSLPKEAGNLLSSFFVPDYPDPYAAEFIQLTWQDQTHEVLCGFVNLKSAGGAYVGFRPFSVKLQEQELVMGARGGCPKLNLTLLD